jgi:DNA-binding NtrC family response regulator
MSSTGRRPGRVLVTDDEEGIRTFLALALEREGHELVQASDGAQALRLVREEPFDVVITDLRMPVLDGMAVVRTLRLEQPGVEVIVLTAFGEVGTAVEAMKLGAFDYLQKPLSGPTAIRDLVSRAIERRRTLAAPAPSTVETGESHTTTHLSFGAPAMVPVIDALQKVASTGATVLLLGESGTGKEVAARFLHQSGPRAAAPFIAINCAALTEELLASELFGHEKGSFTGAHAQRRGRLELADGGTFLLDEVGELRPALQAKLLRVLEERRFERVGGSVALSVDVRWVAATNRDLRTMVRDGLFREDLYHRLAVFPIRLPPLRERREDIVPLAEALLAQLGGRASVAPRLDELTSERLRSAPWPGNIREMRNVLERALILAQGDAIRPEHLWLESEVPTPMGAEAGAEGSLADLERQTIQKTLAAVGGNRRQAAEKLGIGLRTLYDKLKRYELH